LSFLLSYLAAIQKKIEDLFFTVTKILSTARNFEQLHIFLSSAWKQNVLHVRHTFVCRAVDTFCVEQLTFLKKVSSSRDLSRCISSSWPWLLISDKNASFKWFPFSHAYQTKKQSFQTYSSPDLILKNETNLFRESKPWGICKLWRIFKRPSFHFSNRWFVSVKHLKAQNQIFLLTFLLFGAEKTFQSKTFAKIKNSSIIDYLAVDVVVVSFVDNPQKFWFLNCIWLHR
jgi:hypothetical protein